MIITMYIIARTDIDECMNREDNNCSLNANCTDTDGSYTCTCHHGFTGDGVNCAGECQL